METDFKKLLADTDLTDRYSIERYALLLEGMTFSDVLELGIYPSDATDLKDYSTAVYKGGIGNLIEERYFGYRANSESEADFPKAGVELKTTCYDVRKTDKKPSAGERLVVTMIPYDREISDNLYESHLWNKISCMLLVFYRRDRSIPKYAQQITHVMLFEIPSQDLDVIKEDYVKIVSLIQQGRADELSEGLTTYLGAATKGATAEKSIVRQFYPFVDPDTGEAVWRTAKKRAFSLKRSYMDFVLNKYVLGKRSGADRIVSGSLGQETFDQRIERMIDAHVGKSGQELCAELGLVYTGNKSQYPVIAYRLLGVKTSQAEEFVKANIGFRVIRIENSGRIKESLSFAPFEFLELLAEDDWEDSRFRAMLDESRFFFVLFKADEQGVYRLAGCRFWSMPEKDIDGEAKRCWEETRRIVRKGVSIVPKVQRNGKVTYHNNLPGMQENPVAHVRPHASCAAYRFADGTTVGNVDRDASELPDGRWMTKQSFWLNNDYLRDQLGV